MTTILTGRSYQGIPVLVTGGLGFIGSNLAIALVREGAQVTVVDSLVAGCGGDPANLAPVRDQIRISTHGIQETEPMRRLIPDQRVIFNLAGEVSHINSMTDPLRDLSINCSAQLQFLELCRALNSKATIVYASSRQVYGKSHYMPVDEAHPVNPVDYNGIHKHTAEQYHFFLRRQFHMRTMCLRLGNVYGPRQAIRQDCRGFIDVFVRLALEGRQIEVYGDGTQLRGMTYVDDIVDAFLRAGMAGPEAAPVYNVGHPEPIPLLRIAQTLSRLTGAPAPQLVPFPPERLEIDIGHYATDPKRFAQEFGWIPQVGLEEGLRSTIQFFQCQERRALHADSHPVR